MITMGLNVRGVKGVTRAWDKITQHYANDLRPWYAILRTVWYAGQEKQFDSRGRYLASKWKPLGYLANGGPPGEYGRWKAIHFPGKPLMELTGALRSAMTGTGRAWKSVRKRGMVLGVRGFDGWDALNFGNESNHVPARPMAGLSKAWFKELDSAVKEHIAEINRELNREAAQGLASESRGRPGGMLR